MGYHLDDLADCPRSTLFNSMLFYNDSLVPTDLCFQILFWYTLKAKQKFYLPASRIHRVNPQLLCKVPGFIGVCLSIHRGSCCLGAQWYLLVGGQLLKRVAAEGCKLRKQWKICHFVPQNFILISVNRDYSKPGPFVWSNFYNVEQSPYQPRS